MTVAELRIEAPSSLRGAGGDLPFVLTDARSRPAPRLAARRWMAVIAMLDVAAASCAVVVAARVRFGGVGRAADVPAVVLALLPLLWVATLHAGRAHDTRLLGGGTEEYRRVANAGMWFLAVVAFVSYATHLNLSRELVAIAVPLTAGLTLVTRSLTRTVLRRRLAQGAALRRVVLAGETAETSQLVRHLRRTPGAGFVVVGACVPAHEEGAELSGLGVPVLGSTDEIAEVAAELDADTVAVAGSRAFAHGDLQELSWQLEGTGVELVVAPAITDVAGPRVTVGTVGGLPLLHVEEPAFTGMQRCIKAVFDRLGALLLLLLLSPMIAAISLAIRLTSRGSAFYRQERVGRNGKRFLVLKFRTMVEGADRALGELAERNEHDGVLFKIREDPRVTRVGRRLRRCSLDELPQLWNVLCGSMSLVGPRPPLVDEVARYPQPMHRRLLVKPGITGLWQVSGRADLTWEETVRLDLHYVENWSVALDVWLLWRTIGAVLVGRGAY